MQRHVLGFAFHDAEVLLLHHGPTGPATIQNRWNGVGGKIEEGEGNTTAMRREFKEEAGVDVPEARWRHSFVMEFPDCEVDVYVTDLEFDEVLAINDFDAAHHAAPDAEPVSFFHTKGMPLDVVHNLNWLVPMLETDAGPVSGRLRFR